MHWDTYEELRQEWEHWNDMHEMLFMRKSKELVGDLEERIDSQNFD